MRPLKTRTCIHTHTPGTHLALHTHTPGTHSHTWHSSGTTLTHLASHLAAKTGSSLCVSMPFEVHKKLCRARGSSTWLSSWANTWLGRSSSRVVGIVERHGFKKAFHVVGLHQRARALRLSGCYAVARTVAQIDLQPVSSLRLCCFLVEQPCQAGGLCNPN